MSTHRRGYDSLFLQRIAGNDQHPLVADLINVCVERLVPMSEVAALMGVSRVTIYNWLAGTQPRKRHLAMLPSITAQLRKRKVR